MGKKVVKLVRKALKHLLLSMDMGFWFTPKGQIGGLQGWVLTIVDLESSSPYCKYLNLLRHSKRDGGNSTSNL